MSKVQTVREIYDAFGRGDVAAIMSRLSDSVAWEYGPVSTNVPRPQRRRGRDGAASFFASMAEFEMHRFTPKEFFEGPGVVVGLLDVELTVRATGGRIAEEDEIHVWRFDSAGRVVRYQHGLDTHMHHLAWVGDPPTG